MVSILNAVRDLGRLRQIYVVLVRHGFGELAARLGFGGGGKTPKTLALAAGSEAITTSTDSDALEEAVPESEAKRGEDERTRISLPERVRLALMDLGPSFVKLGQIASTRPDVIPASWIVELKKLQDEVNPLGFEEIQRAVEASLGAPIETLYASFDQKPLAAASIGQVHRAVLRQPDGPESVVVKVQRPGVRATVARDLELLHALAALVERTIPESKIYSPVALVDQFDRAITSELDFLQEAEHAQKFSRNFEGNGSARFPKVYKEASSKQVLTLEFLPGKKVYDAIKIDGHDGKAIAKTTTRVVLKMIFEDGFFHADPHPGNILISGTREEPVIGLVDLGMVGRLSPEMRDKTVDMMVAAVRQDPVALADALYAIGTPTKKIDMRAYRAEVAELSEKYLGRPLKEIDFAAMIGDLVRGATKYGLEIPADFLLVGKAMMTMEGVGKEIDPDLDVFGTAKPFFFELMRKRYAPERVGMEVWRGLERLSGAAYEMPQQLREILDDLRLGRLSMQTSDPTLPKTVDRLGRRLFTGLVVAALVLAGTWLVGGSKERTLGIVLLASGVAMMLVHTIRDVLRKG
jgi:ubiquinone biosynthesis protein